MLLYSNVQQLQNDLLHKDSFNNRLPKFFRSCSSHAWNSYICIYVYCKCSLPVEREITTVVLLLSFFLFNTIWVSIMRMSQFLIPLGYGYLTVRLFSIPFKFLYTIQELWYLGKIVLVSIRFRMALTQTNFRVYKDSLPFTYPQVSSLIPILIPCNQLYTEPALEITL